MKNEAFIAWHGSPYTFDRFDFSKLRDGLGVFFTADKPPKFAKALPSAPSPNASSTSPNTPSKQR